MAKKGSKGRKRQRNQQRMMYDELDKYPVMPPHAFARIVRDEHDVADPHILEDERHR